MHHGNILPLELLHAQRSRFLVEIPVLHTIAQSLGRLHHHIMKGGQTVELQGVHAQAPELRMHLPPPLPLPHPA